MSSRDDATPFNLWEGAEVIHGYSRAQAIEDGVLVDLRQGELDALAKEAGIRLPAACTSEFFEAWINPSENDERDGQSITGRLWDLFQVFRWQTVCRAKAGAVGCQLEFHFIVWRDGRSQKAPVKAICGPGDTAEPVLTFMHPHED